MKRCLMTLCIVTLVVGGTWAQKKKTMPESKSDSAGPSLEDTMKFIEDKLMDEGEIHYAVYTHDNQSGQDSTNQYTSYTLTNFRFDPKECRYAYHVTSSLWKDGSWFELTNPVRNIKQIEVMPAARWWTLELADEGYPTKTARVEPPFFMLSVKRTAIQCSENGKPVACSPETPNSRLLLRTWSFRDEDTATRVAKAMTHAAELCGGGSEPEPF